MKDLSDHVHTIQLSSASWSGIWSDMGIEVSYNRIGKGIPGIVGQSTNMETVNAWAHSLNSCCEVVECLEAMEDRSTNDSMHKEERKSRITNDEIDQNILRKKLEDSIDIFDSYQHGEELVNIVTGKINNNTTVNVDDSIRIGQEQMKSFEDSLPSGLYDTISKNVKTMADIKRGVKAGNKIVLDPEVIYARALALRTINPDFDLEK